jgi:precorrin-6B methylase 2
MRVLDVGSGGGDTALLAADLVGDQGEVVGIDRSPVAVAALNRASSGWGGAMLPFASAPPKTSLSSVRSMRSSAATF